MVKRICLELGMENCGMVEDRRDPRWPSSPITLLKAEPARAGYSGPCLVEFLTSSGTETPQPLSANCSSVWSPFHFFSLMFKQIFLYSTLCPLPLVYSLCINEKSLAPSSFCNPVQCLYILVRYPWAFSSQD